MAIESSARRVAESIRRPLAVGAREVVAALLDHQPTRADVRALLVGTRIDARGLAGFSEPSKLAPEGVGAIFIFRYGVVVLFGASAEIEADILSRLGPHIVDRLAVPEVETATIEVQLDAHEQVDARGHVILNEPTAERLLLTATVLARSVVLGWDEVQIANAFERIEPLVAGLKAHGRAGLPIRRVMQYIGDVLDARNRVVGRAQISEKPDILWDHPHLDRLYARLETEFELGDRERVIERKLEVIGDAADVLLNLVQDKRSVRLELAIIGLFAIEILMTLYTIWRG